MGKTGAALGHIRSLGLWLSLPGVAKNRVDADEVSGRHSDATVGKKSNCQSKAKLLLIYPTSGS